jgi:hypothetical protein
MAAPTPPTLVTLTTEALKKAGYASPSAAQLARAQDYYMEEIKQDIFLLGKRLKPLMAEHVEVLAGGLSRYDFPAAFSSIASATILYGDEALDVTGTAAASVTLDTSDETTGEDEVEGKQILIYSGTGKGSMAQCYSYDTTTYVASVSPVWAKTSNAVAPVIGDHYVIIDDHRELDLKSVIRFDQEQIPFLKGFPQALYQVGDDDQYGYYHLHPCPDDDYYYGLHIRYYLNLLTLDLAGTRMATLYARWRNLWIQGVKAKQLEDDDDERSAIEMQRYYNMVKDTVSLETYGRDVKPHYTGIKA